MSRPPRLSFAVVATPTVAARSDASSVICFVRTEWLDVGGPRGVTAQDGERDARPRVDRDDRRVGAERDHGAGIEQALPRVAAGLGAGAPVAACGGGVLAEVDRLDGRRDAERGEPAPVVGVAQLDVLEPGHVRRGGGRRRERVERRSDRRVADGVDLGRDPGLGGARRERRQARPAAS